MFSRSSGCLHILTTGLEECLLALIFRAQVDALPLRNWFLEPIWGIETMFSSEMWATERARVVYLPSFTLLF